MKNFQHEHYFLHEYFTYTKVPQIMVCIHTYLVFELVEKLVDLGDHQLHYALLHRNSTNSGF